MKAESAQPIEDSRTCRRQRRHFLALGHTLKRTSGSESPEEPRHRAASSSELVSHGRVVVVRPHNNASCLGQSLPAHVQKIWIHIGASHVPAHFRQHPGPSAALAADFQRQRRFTTEPVPDQDRIFFDLVDIRTPTGLGQPLTISGVWAVFCVLVVMGSCRSSPTASARSCQVRRSLMGEFPPLAIRRDASPAVEHSATMRLTRAGFLRAATDAENRACAAAGSQPARALRRGWRQPNLPFRNERFRPPHSHDLAIRRRRRG